MSANTTPIFPVTPNIKWVSGVAANSNTAGVTANTTKDLTSGAICNLYLAGANGSRVDFIRIRALGTNVATVVRIWVNNGGSTNTAANNALFTDLTIPATTNSEAAQLAETTINLNMSLPTNYALYATFGTAVAAGFHITTVGGDY
jgi:hypothetical protein